MEDGTQGRADLADSEHELSPAGLLCSSWANVSLDLVSPLPAHRLAPATCYQPTHNSEGSHEDTMLKSASCMKMKSRSRSLHS